MRFSPWARSSARICGPHRACRARSTPRRRSLNGDNEEEEEEEEKEEEEVVVADPSSEESALELLPRHEAMASICSAERCTISEFIAEATVRGLWLVLLR